jgi:hypothetical protein
VDEKLKYLTYFFKVHEEDSGANAPNNANKRVLQIMNTRQKFAIDLKSHEK